MQKEELAYKLVRSLRRVNHNLWRINDAVFDKTGLTRSEVDVLFTIFHYNKNKDERITASKIAEIMEVTLPAIMHKLTDLEGKNYVSRECSVKDKRRKFVNITEKWMDVIKEIDKIEENKTMKFMDGLPNKGVNFVEVLSDFANYLEGDKENNV